MKLSIAPAALSGYSLSTTSSFSMNVFGCTKIFRGCAHGAETGSRQHTAMRKLPAAPVPMPVARARSRRSRRVQGSRFRD